MASPQLRIRIQLILMLQGGVVLTGCALPGAEFRNDQGHERIDARRLEGIIIGQTRRADAIRWLGRPNYEYTNGRMIGYMWTTRKTEQVVKLQPAGLSVATAGNL